MLRSQNPSISKGLKKKCSEFVEREHDREVPCIFTVIQRVQNFSISLNCVLSKVLNLVETRITSVIKDNPDNQLKCLPT